MAARRIAPYESMEARLLANSRDLPAVTWRGTCCRVWTGRLNIDNYPHMCMRVPGRKHPVPVLAHRVACELANGPPPFPRAQALHRCNVPQCINGKHLQWGSDRENKLYFSATAGAIGGDEADFFTIDI